MALRTDLSGTKKITVLGLLLAAGIVLNLAENMIPVFTVLPGGKLGLANVVTMLVMLWFGPLTALVLGVLRSLLTGILSGMATMAVYGGMGTVLSVAAMWLFFRLFREKVSMAGLSMLGAFFFNVGQIAVAAAVVHNWQLFRYLPVLTLLSTICGLFTGIVAGKTAEKRIVGD